MTNSGAWSPWRPPKKSSLADHLGDRQPETREWQSKGKGPSSRKAGRPNKNPKKAATRAAAQKGRKKGKCALDINAMVPYAPMAKKPAWPIEICPVYPTRMFRPDRDDDVNGDVVGHVHIVVLEQEREYGEKNHEAPQTRRQ